MFLKLSKNLARVLTLNILGLNRQICSILLRKQPKKKQTNNITFISIKKYVTNCLELSKNITNFKKFSRLSKFKSKADFLNRFISCIN